MELFLHMGAVSTSQWYTIWRKPDLEEAWEGHSVYLLIQLVSDTLYDRNRLIGSLRMLVCTSDVTTPYDVRHTCWYVGMYTCCLSHPVVYAGQSWLIWTVDCLYRWCHNCHGSYSQAIFLCNGCQYPSVYKRGHNWPAIYCLMRKIKWFYYTYVYTYRHN